MKIIRLELKGYKRLALAHIKHLVYEPHAAQQVIVGTNGSGKSSLLYELSAMPANHRMYDAGGMKKITIEHKGSIYELTSDFSKGNSHSFIKDGVELNAGTGTYSVQLELVYRHFKLNSKVHELILGKKRFSYMSIAERRQWFTELADADYSYAIGVYTSLKERLRDISGAIKIAKKKLSIETTKSYSSEDIARLESKVKDIYECVQALQEERISETPLAGSMARYEQTESQLVSKVEAVAGMLTNLKQVKSIATIEHDLQEAIAQLRAHETISDRQAHQYSEICKDYGRAKSVQDKNTHELKAQLKSMVATINKNKEAITNRDIYDDLCSIAHLRQLQAKIREAIQRIIDHSSQETIAEYRHRYASSEYRDSILKECDTISASINVATNRLQWLTDEIAHLEHLSKGASITCPKCKYSWIKDYNPEVNNRLLKEKKDIQEKLDILNNKYREYLSMKKEIIIYNQAIDNIISNLDIYPLMINIDDLINGLSNIDYIRYLNSVLDDINIIMQNRELMDNADKISDIIHKADTLKDVNIESIYKEKQKLQAQMSDTAESIRVYTLRVKTLRQASGSLAALMNAKEDLQALMRDMSKSFEDSLEYSRRVAYNEYLRLLQSSLARAEDSLHTAKTHYQSTTAIEKDIVELEKKESVYKELCIALSPAEGIIAEGLFGYMRLYISQMNQLIAKIWSYPLVVNPCQLDSSGSVDLDYRFPVVVDNQDYIRKDVSEGSSAMQEVIDLAFKIVAMKALGLGDYPLYLDEFGSTMDPAHKAATISLINNIMTEGHYSQLFMVSHDSIQYGALSNTETVVLSKANMMLSNSCYNTNVKINEE